MKLNLGPSFHPIGCPKCGSLVAVDDPEDTDRIVDY